MQRRCYVACWRCLSVMVSILPALCYRVRRRSRSHGIGAKARVYWVLAGVRRGRGSFDARGKAVGPERMNRTGLAIAIVVAVVVGVLFGVYPRLDLDISALFYDPRNNVFALNTQPWVRNSRAAAEWLVGLIVAPAFLSMIGKLILPRWRMPVGGCAALFLIVTLALGPGLLANVLLKDHWGRARPLHVTHFRGTDRFTAWWDPRGRCSANCSFIAGEPSGAFWTLAPLRLWRSACIWRRSRRSAHRGRRAFFQRRDVRRRFRLSPDMGDTRAAVSLAGDPHHRPAHRASGDVGRRNNAQRRQYVGATFRREARQALLSLPA
jgi:hypothetical protein